MNNNIFFVDNYHDNLPARFKVFDDCEISDFIKNNVIWEPHLHTIFEKYITKDFVVIEAGCHIGTHTIKLAKLCKTLYTFEPMPISYELLRTNIELNDLHNVIMSANGLSNKIYQSYFEWTCQGNIGSSGLANNPMGKPEMVSETINKIFVDLINIDSLHMDKLDFIKIDVEGYEELVIEGAMDTICKYKPIITMEVWKNHFGEFDLEYTKNKFHCLIEIGYEVFHIEGPDFLFIYLERAEDEVVGERLNSVCVNRRSSKN